MAACGLQQVAVAMAACGLLAVAVAMAAVRRVGSFEAFPTHFLVDDKAPANKPLALGLACCAVIGQTCENQIHISIDKGVCESHADLMKAKWVLYTLDSVRHGPRVAWCHKAPRICLLLNYAFRCITDVP